MKRLDVRWTALELRAECRPHLELLVPRPEIIITDKFVSPGLPEVQKPLHGRRFDVALGNPPFTLDEEFVEESMKLADTVVMLLRLNFIGSSGRCAFMQKHPPDVYVLPDRPSFDGRGTDSIEYAWFVWQSGARSRDAGRVTVLNTTPVAVRSEIRRQHELQHAQAALRTCKPDLATRS